MAIMEGANGWLFLTDGSNDTLAYSTGRRTIDERVVRGWHRLLELREAWLSARGVALYTFVAPNKEVVYADRLPADSADISERRPVRLIEERLAHCSDARLEYPVEALVAERDVRETYPADDGHWNGWGAYVFYRKAMQLISKALTGVAVLDESDVRFVDVEVRGDLGRQVDPTRRGRTVAARLDAPRASVTFDNHVVNNGHLTRTEWSRRSSGPKLLVFHDSFHTWTQPLFAESFPVMVSAHNYRLDHGLVEQERPDAIVVEITERFLVRVPDDVEGMTTAEMQAAKVDGRLAANDGFPIAGDPLGAR